MAAKLIFLAGVIGVGGYVGNTMMNHDPSVLAMSREQIETKLVEARTTLPSRDGPDLIQIWANGRTARGVDLAMRYSDSSPVIECLAVVNEVDPGKSSRVKVDCSDEATGSSAIGRTQVALRAPMFEEHVLSTLQGRPFDRKTVDAKEGSIAMGGIGSMRREAMVEADKMQREHAQGLR